MFDGWPLAYAPGSPAALHLLELLESLPESYTAWLAIPAECTHPQQAALAHADVSLTINPHRNTSVHQARWEQIALPRAAQKVKANLLHTTRLRVPLFCPVPVLVSPAEWPADAAVGADLASRLGDSAASGGLSRARAILWPEDLPEDRPSFPSPVWRIPPLAHSAFFMPQERLSNLPGDYVLACGQCSQDTLELLAAAWSWASTGLGEDCSLLVLNLGTARLNMLRGLCESGGCASRVDSVSAATPQEYASVLQSARAVISLGDLAPWGDAVLYALASGRPLAAVESVRADARAGPASYLTPPGDARALGAAVLTLAVEETLAESLSSAAHARAARWNRQAFRRALGEIYSRVLL